MALRGHSLRYQLEHPGEDSDEVADIYQVNQKLRARIGELEDRLEEAKRDAERARASKAKLRQEADFHSLNHRRAVERRQQATSELARSGQCPLSGGAPGGVCACDPLLRPLTRQL